MAEVPLYRGKAQNAPVVAVAHVDDDDLPLVSRFRWTLLEQKRHAKVFRYARTRIPRGDGTYRQVTMHRVVLGITEDRTWDGDHRDGDGLNNRRSNLRLCTHAENMQNRRQYARASRFRGVQQLPSGTWRARYGGSSAGGRQAHIGTFATELEAALAAEEYRKIHAPFAEPDPALIEAMKETRAP